jgi:hypothetical protein
LYWKGYQNICCVETFDYNLEGAISMKKIPSPSNQKNTPTTKLPRKKNQRLFSEQHHIEWGKFSVFIIPNHAGKYEKTKEKMCI